MSKDYSKEFESLVAPLRDPHTKKGSRIPIENRMEVIKKLSKLGCPIKRISELARLSVKTVKNYLANIPEQKRGGGRPTTDAKRCLTPNCKGMTGGGKGGGRGLCISCHASATKLVKKRKTSWEELELLGLARPRCSSRFERLLIEAKKKRDKDP